MLQQYVAEQGATAAALNYDFGLITLSSPAPSGTSVMMIAAGVGSSVSYNLQTAGYPADKPSQTMWQVGCRSIVPRVVSLSSQLCMGQMHKGMCWICHLTGCKSSGGVHGIPRHHGTGRCHRMFSKGMQCQRSEGG